jgi:regulator of protease activity HflC (stomatin/prohibitin superfamily)
MPYSTGPTEVGVRTVKFGIFRKAGVDQKVYPPGSTYWFLPIINEWHTFDTKIQVLEMTLEPGKGDRKGRDDLLFKTIDGNDISLDVIISYRIDPKMAPYILQYVAQSDQELRENLVRTVTRSTPRDIFGELKTEELYVADERAKKAARAKEVLNRILNPYGIIVENVLTKDYRFNPAYQKAIEERKVADQLAEKAKSEARAAEEEYRRKLQDAIGEVNQMIAQADGEFLRAKIEADAYYEQQSKRAQAILAEAEAEAKGLAKMTSALEGKGGDVLVKLKIAEALRGKPIVLLPVSGGSLDVKTTDINRLLELYGLKGLKEGGKALNPSPAPPPPVKGENLLPGPAR